jgi:histidyl-tRNA synthetase
VDNPRSDKTFSYAFDNGIPLILIIGEEEIEKGIYKIRSLNENKEYEVSKDDLLSKVQELVQANPVLLAKEKEEEAKN